MINPYDAPDAKLENVGNTHQNIIPNRLWTLAKIVAIVHLLMRAQEIVQTYQVLEMFGGGFQSNPILYLNSYFDCFYRFGLSITIVFIAYQFKWSVYGLLAIFLLGILLRHLLGLGSVDFRTEYIYVPIIALLACILRVRLLAPWKTT